MSRRRRTRAGGQSARQSKSNEGTNQATGRHDARAQTQGRQGGGRLRWFKADLHTHTPASNDYEEPGITYLQWLTTARERGLDIVAITDHNTVAGVAAIRREIEWLTRLKEENRLTTEERSNLEQWLQLANEIVILPGFEFTATFGFHILAIYPPETSVRKLEHTLLRLNVPEDRLLVGSTETGASTDVTSAYETIVDSGGIAIAAHANSTNGVAMRNFPFGGQTKIAYTQDHNLSALEVTDLESRSRRATARFFNGSKTEYPRKMHCIQGSDAHRLNNDPRNSRRLGLGERATELLLPEPTFDAIRELFASRFFDRTRPFRAPEKEVDHLAAARAEGPNQTQSFHESANKKGGRQTVVLADLCAFANTDGGTIFVGASARKGRVKGLAASKQVQNELQLAISERLSPPLEARFEILTNSGEDVLRIGVDAGDSKPYCLDGSKFYVRNDAETSMALRDEIVALVLESVGLSSDLVANGDADETPAAAPEGSGRADDSRTKSPGATSGRARQTSAGSDDPFYLPQDGVEIVDSETRGGTTYYVVRNMRNQRSVGNVTRKGARKLWNYAIAQYEDSPVKAGQIRWKENVGYIRSGKRAGKKRFDLALREGSELRVFYGVTSEGMEGAWAQFVDETD
ncbi:MAG: putative DNA binding domain-containing protein [Caldilineaceae bacterium]|nr:putative DNA binding domain-containing protein [Caldilineaceae bacterium]